MGAQMRVPLKKLMDEAKARALSGKSEENMTMVSYNQEDIQLCINALNDLTTKGIENARIIAIIADKLLNPLPEPAERKEEPDASHKEE